MQVYASRGPPHCTRRLDPTLLRNNVCLCIRVCVCVYLWLVEMTKTEMSALSVVCQDSLGCCCCLFRHIK